MVYCFEQMLCYWAWLKQDHYWMANDKQQLGSNPIHLNYGKTTAGTLA
jgi:hypothetical protein